MGLIQKHWIIQRQNDAVEQNLQITSQFYFVVVVLSNLQKLKCASQLIAYIQNLQWTTCEITKIKIKQTNDKKKLISHFFELDDKLDAT